MNKDKIKFINEEENIIDAYLYCLANNLVQIKFDENERPSDKILLSGFEVLNENTLKNQSGDYYHNYKTIYREIDENTIILSNDESIYYEGDSEGGYVDIDSDSTLIEGYVPTLEETKERKIQSLSSICNQSIVNGVDIDINGEIKWFDDTKLLRKEI